PIIWLTQNTDESQDQFLNIRQAAHDKVLNTWKNYFKRLSNIVFENNREIDLEFYMVKVMINELTISEVKSAIKRLKNYKTPIQVCLKDTKDTVKISNQMSEIFNIHNQLKQGDVLSPLLFNLVLRYVIKKMQESEGGLRLNGITTVNICE
ncbi:craniofacial development protein 2-like, partial [Vespula maculifrons]